MTEEVKTVRDPLLVITAPARVPTLGEDFAAYDTASVDACEAQFRRRGWRVKETANVRLMDHRFAGSDAARAAGLQEAFDEVDADVILCLRGGYGTARLLPKVDWERAGASCAAFVGLSDTTAVNCALYAVTGKASWQGPVARAFRLVNPARDAVFEAALMSETFHLKASVTGEAFNAGGIFWGGNLAILTSLVGTPWFPKIDGGILYVEDVAEPAWRIERMLLQLIQAGVLTRQRALIVGGMTGADKTAGEGAGRFSLSDALAWIRREAKIPVASGLRFGHLADTLTLPFGVESDVASDGSSLTVTAYGCASPASLPWREAPPADLWWH